ncbi:unnamed protein product, partial [Ectocarpus sp. 13 AM-2016]
TQQASAQTGLFGAAPAAAAPAPGQAGGAAAAAAAAAGSVSEGAAERREEFMLDSLVCAVEVLFFIYYSYQIKPGEAKQLVTLVETAGRELLALQKTVAETDGITPTATAATAGGGGLHYTNGLSGYGFGHGATAAAAPAAAAGVTGSFGAFVGGGGDEAERHRDVFRLCAALEVTSVLLCTLSMALSQNNALYSRSVPGAKNNGRNALNALALVVGGGGGQPLGDGDKEVILHLNKEICSREWDHSQVQGAVMMVWASFIAPFASGGQTVADTDADKQLRQVMAAAAVNGAVKFLRGPVLTVLRRPPFAARSVAPRPFYLEALSGLAATYVGILLDAKTNCRFPYRFKEQLDHLQANWNHSVNAGGPGVAPELLSQLRKEDTLEDLIFWTGQLSEAHPEFADKRLWLERDDESLPMFFSAMATPIEHRDTLGPLLCFL